MLIRLNVDQVRVVWAVGLWGWLGRYGAGPTRGPAAEYTGLAENYGSGRCPATQSRKFENKSNKMRILAISILKLRPALNAAAFSTYTVKISDLKVVFFMVYTYNIQGQCDGTRHRQMIWSNFHATPPHPTPPPVSCQ